MQITINIVGDELDSKLAAKHLHMLADQVKAGVVHAEGFSIDFMGDYSLDVDYGTAFPHGDYQDAEGNLVHVANDAVVNVTWANKDAEVEEVNVPIGEWMEDHGQLHPAGHDHGHEGGHEH